MGVNREVREGSGSEWRGEGVGVNGEVREWE